jgi:hypothetical protein
MGPTITRQVDDSLGWRLLDFALDLYRCHRVKRNRFGRYDVITSADRWRSMNDHAPPSPIVVLPGMPDGYVATVGMIDIYVAADDA